jgi:hypothetical protein
MLQRTIDYNPDDIKALEMLTPEEKAMVMDALAFAPSKYIRIIHYFYLSFPHSHSRSSVKFDEFKTTGYYIYNGTWGQHNIHEPLQSRSRGLKR